MHRCNLMETTEGGLALCRGNHERGDACEWEYFMPNPTALEVAKLCLHIAMTGTHNPLAGEVRRAIVTIFGPEVDAQLQSDLLKPL